jgi:hypothetical protein
MEHGAGPAYHRPEEKRPGQPQAEHIRLSRLNVPLDPDLGVGRDQEAAVCFGRSLIQGLQHILEDASTSGALAGEPLDGERGRAVA